MGGRKMWGTRDGDPALGSSLGGPSTWHLGWALGLQSGGGRRETAAGCCGSVADGCWKNAGSAAAHCSTSYSNTLRGGGTSLLLAQPGPSFHFFLSGPADSRLVSTTPFHHRHRRRRLHFPPTPVTSWTWTSHPARPETSIGTWNATEACPVAVPLRAWPRRASARPLRDIIPPSVPASQALAGR